MQRYDEKRGADKGDNAEIEVDRIATYCSMYVCVCVSVHVFGVLAWRSHPSLEACCYIVHVNSLMHVCFMALI